MSAPHAKSDDDFDDGVELDADAFDAIEALALTQKPPLTQQLPDTTGQPAPAPTLIAAPSEDAFSDDSYLLDDETLAAFDAIDAAYEATQQQQQQPATATPATSTMTAVPALASAPASALASLPPSSLPTASSTSSQPVVAEPVLKPTLKRTRGADDDSQPPRKRTRTNSYSNLQRQADAHEASIRKLIDEMQCAVCLQHIVHPHNLASCGHCACASCINGWFLARVKEGKQISCPVCRESLPRSTKPAPAYMMNNCATTLVPHLNADEQNTWRERTAEWKKDDWTWKSAPIVQPVVVYEIIDDVDDGASDDDDYSGDDDDDDDDDLSDADIEIEVPASRHGNVLRLTAVVDLT
ncbi:hypothetical protein AURDEDRAFT_179205 [Auricularia subglabra TFB-10046 SS5]|nr:hypothetical protein AURDEDRAFT_179205 [Auricularia subglabra TFB-10046 SS5]